MGLPAELPSPARHHRSVPVVLSGVVVACMALIGLGGAMVAAASPAAAASAGCGSLGSGSSVFMGRAGACVVPPTSQPYATFTDGEKVDLAMGPNTVFSPSDGLGGDVEALECEYRTAAGQPGNPPNADYCDAQTTAADFPQAVQPGGSFDYSIDNGGDNVTVYAVPDKTLTLASIKCNATHACVWYVGENYNNFTSPHVFSSPFFVGAAASAGGSGSLLPVIIIIVVVALVAAVVFRFILVPRRRRLAQRSR